MANNEARAYITMWARGLHYSVDLPIQTYTERVPLKYGKLATLYPWIYGNFLQCSLSVVVSEMHRTQSEFEDQYTFKVFIFQFVNFYSSIIYIGFIKGKSVSPPTSIVHLYLYLLEL